MKASLDRYTKTVFPDEPTRIILTLTKEDVEYLVEDRRRILEDRYMSRKDEDTTLALLDAIIMESEREIL